MKKIVASLIVFCFACVMPAVVAGNLFCFSINEQESNFALVRSNSSAAEDAQEQPLRFVVSANSAVVFAAPDFSSEKIATLKHKDEIVVLADGGAPVTEDWNGFQFLKISLQENAIEWAQEFGYVFADLVTAKKDEIVAIPNFNAKTNKECQVFSEENGAFSPTSDTLARGQAIFLYEGFNAKKDFNAIAYVLDGKVLYGFLKTDDISPNGINPVIITCIILIVAVLSIIFAWLFMKNKHVSLKKKKPGKYDLK